MFARFALCLPDYLGDCDVEMSARPATDLTYKGRPIVDLSRDELMIALTWAYGALEDERRWHREGLETMSMFEDARKTVASRWLR